MNAIHSSPVRGPGSRDNRRRGKKEAGGVAWAGSRGLLSSPVFWRAQLLVFEAVGRTRDPCGYTVVDFPIAAEGCTCVPETSVRERTGQGGRTSGHRKSRGRLAGNPTMCVWVFSVPQPALSEVLSLECTCPLWERSRGIPFSGFWISARPVRRLPCVLRGRCLSLLRRTGSRPLPEPPGLLYI